MNGVAFDWHDATCPEAGECRDRHLHATTGGGPVLAIVERVVGQALARAQKVDVERGDNWWERDWSLAALSPTPVPSEVAETTAGERDRTFLLPDDCDCLPPYADCTHGPAEPDAGEAEALAKVRVLDRSYPLGDEAARAVLASDWLAALLDRVRREEGAKAWDAGHRHRQRRGPDECQCGAYYDGECGCGKYGSGPLVSLKDNPYRAASVGRGEGP